MKTINVCGVLVRTHAENAQSVRTQLESMEGVEVHEMTKNGQLVITVEKETQQETGDTINRFQELDHVLSTSVVYQYFEPDAASELENT